MIIHRHLRLLHVKMRTTTAMIPRYFTSSNFVFCYCFDWSALSCLAPVLIHRSGRKGHLGRGTLSTEHMLHHGGLYSVLTPFGAHMHVAEEKGRKLWLQMMTEPFGGAAGTGFLREGCWIDGWKGGSKDGWMDRTSGGKSAHTLNAWWCWCCEHAHVQILPAGGMKLGTEPVRGTGLNIEYGDKTEQVKVNKISLTWLLWTPVWASISSPQETRFLMLLRKKDIERNLSVFNFVVQLLYHTIHTTMTVPIFIVLLWRDMPEQEIK